MDGLGDRLKELRKERDLTLDMVIYDISTKYHVDITKGNLSRWENGKNIPTLNYAALLCRYYGVSLDYLIGNTDIKTPVELLTRKIKKEDKI